MTGRCEEDGRLAVIAGRILGGGIAASAVLLLLGLLLWAAGLEPASTTVLETGLGLLMVTPATRVLVALLESGRRRDWFSVTTTLCVALILLGALVSAFRAVP